MTKGPECRMMMTGGRLSLAWSVSGVQDVMTPEGRCPLFGLCPECRMMMMGGRCPRLGMWGTSVPGDSEVTVIGGGGGEEGDGDDICD